LTPMSRTKGSNTNLSSNATSSPSLHSSLVVVAPASAPVAFSASSVSHAPVSPVVQIPSVPPNTIATDGDNQKPKPPARKKKPILIPGKWINSDDEEEEEDEAETGKGWARIIVSSRAR
jgi:hypothetical protein